MICPRFSAEPSVALDLAGRWNEDTPRPWMSCRRSRAVDMWPLASRLARQTSHCALDVASFETLHMSSNDKLEHLKRLTSELRPRASRSRSETMSSKMMLRECRDAARRMHLYCLRAWTGGLMRVYHSKAAVHMYT